jgi:hypothetical protein
MDDTDAFFTQTIVGPPVSVLLGSQQDAGRLSAQGLDVDLTSGKARLSDVWQEWVMLGHGSAASGRPRQRPGAWRRRLERHALWLAFLGVLSLLVSAAIWFAAFSRLSLAA